MPNHNSRLIIDGTLRDAATGAIYPNIDPFTEQTIGFAQDAGHQDVDDAVVAAHAASEREEWSRDTAFRAKCLLQWKDALLSHADELQEALISEIACPIAMVPGLQLIESLRSLDYFATLAETFHFDTYMSPDQSTKPSSQRLLTREPWGVCTLITAYNYPVQQLISKAGAALAAGNAAIVKPSPLTPLTPYLLSKIAAEETDIPRGILSLITTTSPEVSQHLVEHPLVSMIHFTGSTAVGRQIMASASKAVKKVGLELGGKSAMIVLEGGDLAAAVKHSIFRVTRFSGQGCSIYTRLLLPRSVYEEGLALAAQACAATQWGDPRNPTTHLSPQIDRRGQERCLEAIRTAVAEGGRIVCGGGVPKAAGTGFFVEATVIADVDPNSQLAQKEVFGPILAVIPYDTEEEAIAIANNSIFGLAGAVYGPTERALAVARRMKTGMIEVNGASRSAPDTPFGGMKQSGIGRERGIVGFEEYTDLKVIAHH